MALPKPLSAKTIEKKFATWDPEKVDLLHKYFAAFANLYGAIQLKDAWALIRDDKPKPRILKQELIDFSTIVMREDLPYFVLEIHEMYPGERNSDGKRFIVHKNLLLDDSYRRYGTADIVIRHKLGYPYHVPDNFFDYVDSIPLDQSPAFLEFIEIYSAMKLNDGTPLTKVTFEPRLYSKLYSVTHTGDPYKDEQMKIRYIRPFVTYIQETVRMLLHAGGKLDVILDLPQHLIPPVSIPPDTKARMNALVKELQDNTPLWRWHGYTKNEFLKAFPYSS